ncbi:MAG: DUF4397 domain-containing protein [Sediminibacterium sp.]
MKKYSLQYFIPVAALFLLFACKKSDGVTNQPYTAYGVTSATQGQLKINLAMAYTVDYANMLIKVNGKAVSNLLQTRTPFPGGGYNTRGSNFALYLSVPVGSNTVSVVLPKATTDTDSVVLFNGTVTVPDNEPYTLHIADTAASIKSVLVKNVINSMDTGWCRFKFVNLIPNVAAVDLYLNNVKIKSNLAYLVASDTFSIRTGVNQPGYVPGSTTTTFAVRPAGALATTAALASYASNSSLQSQQALTIFTMGYSGSTGTRLPFISFTLDKNK